MLIVDDLPSGTGFWTGGLAIGSGGRLYVAVGAPCGNCEFDERERGAILSMNLDGERPADLSPQDSGSRPMSHFIATGSGPSTARLIRKDRHARDELNLR